MSTNKNITIKSEQDIAAMRIAGRLTSEVLDYLVPFIKPGITTNEIDKLAHDYMVNVQNAIPAPLNYTAGGDVPYPKSICTSVNHQVCHGIPSDKVLKNGDIVNVDVTVIKDGWHGDSSRMFLVGECSIAAKRLCQITYEAMWKGIQQVKPGARLGDIGAAIQKFAEGHSYGKAGTGLELQAGMVFTIEPMINAGKKDIKEGSEKDGWSIVTKDRSLSAQWEHTIVVTPTGYEVLTVSNGTPAVPAFIGIRAV